MKVSSEKFKNRKSGDPPLAFRTVGLEKRFNDHSAINGVDMSVSLGDVVAIIGPSGAGKTTFLRCLALLELPDSGTVELFGRTVFHRKMGSTVGDASNLRTLHRDVLTRVGVVFQSLNLWPHRTVLQNVADPLVCVHGISRKDAEVKAVRELEALGLSGKMSRRPDTLSGGEKQRVALARALVSKPDLLLLDEITSALDLERVADLLSLLRELASSAITLVLVTHELSFAAEVSQQLVFMDKGRVVESAPPQTLLKMPKSHRVREFVSRINEEFRITNGSGR